MNWIYQLDWSQVGLGFCGGFYFCLGLKWVDRKLVEWHKRLEAELKQLTESHENTVSATNTVIYTAGGNGEIFDSNGNRIQHHWTTETHH